MPSGETAVRKRKCVTSGPEVQVKILAWEAGQCPVGKNVKQNSSETWNLSRRTVAKFTKLQ